MHDDGPAGGGAARGREPDAGLSFARIWILGLHDPWRSFSELRAKPAPLWGLRAILIRWLVTSLTTTLALHLLGRVPFTPSRLTFLTPQDYYLAQIFFLPVFGVAIWLLGGSLVHLLVRLSGRSGDFDRVLNVIGMAMLIPSPVVWLWDWSMIALSWYRLTIMAVSHSLFALWGAALYAIGLRRVLGLGWLPAGLLAAALTAGYISLAALFVR